MPIGNVVGEAEPHGFTFTVDVDRVPPLLEYVCIDIQEEVNGSKVKVPVLAQVEEIVQSSPMLKETLPSDAVRVMVESVNLPRHVIAKARILGFMVNGKVYTPRYTPTPGSPVYLAPDELLNQFYAVDPDRAITIGSLINRSSVHVQLDLSGFSRHIAILAATGAGKSFTAGLLMEELLAKGATIVAIDPHGDYSEMDLNVNGRRHSLSDRIVVLSLGPYVKAAKRYYVKVGDLSDDEIAYIAGIPLKAVNIRSALSLALRMVRKEHEKEGDFSLDDVCDKLEEWSSLNEDELREKLKRKVKREDILNALKYLEKLKKLGVFASSSVPLREILKPMHLTVLNLSGVSFEAQDIAVHDLLSRIYEARVSYVTKSHHSEGFPYPVFIFLEEAHRFIPPPQSGFQTKSSDILRTIASEGRKFGVFMVIISQRPSKVHPDILSQAQSQIVLRIVNPRDQQAIADASEAFSQPLLNDLPGLNVGEAIIVGPITKTPVMVKVGGRRFKHGGTDLPIPELLKEAKHEALRHKALEHEEEASLRRISETYREIAGVDA
ncbi:MAG: ATP-binding protein [Candidatus Nezhaarchaeales archaeon]